MQILFSHVSKIQPYAYNCLGNVAVNTNDS
jgi:hypothetical protein